MPMARRPRRFPSREPDPALQLPLQLRLRLRLDAAIAEKKS
jgi:hypothetical protein